MTNDGVSRLFSQAPLRLIVLLLASTACSDHQGGTVAQSDTAGPRSEAEGAEQPVSELARSTLRRLRERFETPAESVGELLAPALLPPSSAVGYRSSEWGLQPIFATWSASPTVRALLQQRGDGWTRLLDGSHAALELAFRLRGAEPSSPEHAEGYLVYAAGREGVRLLRASAEGVEDYLLLEHRPQQSELRYELRLGSAVAGLRLVANVLEAVDASGTPRLRVSPPFLVGADRQRSEAALLVEGCQVDTDPAAPWGRAPIAAGPGSCELVVRWDSAGLKYPALLDPSWSSTSSNMAVPRALHSAIRNDAGTKLLLAGGVTTAGAVTNTAELYDVASKTYAATASMVMARQRHVAENLTALGPVLVAGGNTTLSGSPTASAEKYSWSTGTWSAAGTMTVARAAHASSLTNNSKVLVTGGIGAGNNYLGSAELYSISGNNWTATGSIFQTRAYHTSTPAGGDIFIAGGHSGSAALASTLVYNAQFNFFENRAPLNVGRYRHTATRTSTSPHTVWLAGGVDTAGNPLPSTEVFRIADNSALRSANLSFPRRDHAATLLAMTPASVLVTGGFGLAGAPLKDAELFDISFETLAPTGTAATARGHHSAIAAGSGAVIAGGAPSSTLGAGSTYLNTSEIYDSAGLLPTFRKDYKTMPIVTETDVLPAPYIVELGASVHMPQTLAAGLRYPVAVFLHGQHSTCRDSQGNDSDNTYASTGSCPASYTMTPSYRGYDYIASALAARGYIVLSINANRTMQLINGGPASDPELIMARGKLILKHLKLLKAWDAGAAPPWVAGAPTMPSLVGKVALDQVGLVGHSRGGEALRAALKLFREGTTETDWPKDLTGVNLRGLFELGGTDNHVPGTTLNAPGVKWVQLTGLCDIGVQGGWPLGRMMMNLSDTPGSNTFKAAYWVWGAGHAYWNSEWPTPSGYCYNQRSLFHASNGARGSAEQRQVSFLALLKFFQGSVGASADGTLNRIFNPVYWAPPEPRIDRVYTPSPALSQNKVLEDFTSATGSNSNGPPNGHVNVTLFHRPGAAFGTLIHDPALYAGELYWTFAGTNVYFQANFAPSGSGSGFDLSSYHYLDVRVDRADDPILNTSSSTSFNVQLVNSSGTLSGAVSSASYVSLTGPAKTTEFDPAYPMLQTMRIPLSAFSGATLNNVRAVRFIFSGTSQGRIWLANIRATKKVTGQGSD